ncbi:MAG: amidohydrolase [Chloroflexota bacterium]|nr:MAG: amidohydrolase [Chloroflexota bacterium]
MSTLLIQHADLFTLDAHNAILKNSSLAIQDKYIVAIGEIPPDFRADEIIDGTNHVALPGFFNAHTHAAMTLLRGSAEDLPLDRWFNEGIWRTESALCEEDVYWGTALAACEMIRSGTVAFSDHYFYMHNVARVVQEAGMKAMLAWCVFGSNFAPEMGPTTLELTEEFVAEFQNSAGGRIQTVLGPHSPYISAERALRDAANVARKLGVGCHIHVSESPEQVANSYKQHGKSPVAYLNALGIFDQPSIAAHAIYIDDADIEILRAKNVTVAACPKTHLKLAMKTTRIMALLNAGVNVALGTDGAASNNDLDMLQVTRLAALLQKHETGDATVLPSMQALKLATQHGARAMGFANSGVIQVGAAADLILVNMDKPHLTPRHDLAANVVHSAQGSDVNYVIVDGQVLLRKGELTTLDEEKIMREAETRGLRMVQSNLAQTQRYQSY